MAYKMSEHLLGAHPLRLVWEPAMTNGANFGRQHAKVGGVIRDTPSTPVHTVA